MKHTPTPWFVEDFAGAARIRCGGQWGFRDDVPLMQRVIVNPAKREERDANVTFVVLAVNHHDELVATLRKLVDRNITWLNGVMDCSGITYEDVQSARDLLEKIDAEAQKK